MSVLGQFCDGVRLCMVGTRNKKQRKRGTSVSGEAEYVVYSASRQKRFEESAKMNIVEASLYYVYYVYYTLRSRRVSRSVYTSSPVLNWLRI